MKILVITNLAPTNSNPMAGIFVVKRLEQFIKFGVDYFAVSLGFEDDWPAKLTRKILRKNPVTPLNRMGKVEFTPILIRRSLAKTILFKTGLISYYGLKYSNRIKSLLEISKFDLIHAHGMYSIPAGEIAYLLAKEYNKPFVITLHGSDVNLLMPKRKERYIEILENASRCIFVSRALLEKAKSFGYSGQNAVVIPNGYDPDVFKPMDKNAVRKELGIYKENTHYVGFVGNLIPIKRADKLPEIFGKIAKELPNTRFLIVGDGVLKDKILKEMKGLDVVFTGRVVQTKVAKYMNAMDVMVLPSRNEGWPCVVLEAQACGTCVIGSSNGGIPEAIGFEEYVVEEGENFEDRFARKMVDVLKSGYDRNKLIERAKRFTWEEIVKREIKIYNQVG
ncbi:group 1 glycosyl transferase [Thermotoga sp. Mc24]|uniref:glycosyltransferase family 4 protein n=1 Tax=Thermotoga sp. Mc24 TaxID=1231241 RepID=UPI0005428955|nr:glycosyltransferase family 4 protein [Thermotoga sp. Mc24]KHC90366.1 group 1 glycosyl transferase [Thermotoga sp. Mc24]